LPEKLSKYPNFYDICPKNLQNSRILHDFARKMPEFYVIIARKIFFPDFRGGGHVPPAPVSYAYGDSALSVPGGGGGHGRFF